MLMVNQLAGFGARRPSAGGGGGSDPYFANVVLLLGFEGTNGATSTTDESPSAHSPITFGGNAQIDTSTAAVTSSTSCLVLDTSGDYVSIPDSIDWKLASSNSDQYTIEFWFNPHGNVGGGSWLFGHGDFGDWGWDIDHTQSSGATSALSFNYSSNGSSRTTHDFLNLTISLDTWHFVAISKNSSGKIRAWLDGTLLGSYTPADSSINNSTKALEIGRFIGVTNANSRLDEIRITKGVCRYDVDTSITVPTAAFPRS
ncbi:LamG domain-containing protein [Mesorhizobium sp. 131-2-1]|uniref:LamG domain-containing protein n=1 Tax=Mesorhizobium sp. 131-2-1 TaxID=2744518 RepID=UPI0019264FEF|nr:LamG domain-containing protein [Mesorhizobium sp. 131-2-1]BCG94363.1 hypothetical protein MesoLj131a_32270 [Mesorhizobium sp. 131-2-1]